MSQLPEIHNMNLLCWTVEDQCLLWDTQYAPESHWNPISLRKKPAPQSSVTLNGTEQNCISLKCKGLFYWGLLYKALQALLLLFPLLTSFPIRSRKKLGDWLSPPQNPSQRKGKVKGNAPKKNLLIPLFYLIS